MFRVVFRNSITKRQQWTFNLEKELLRVNQAKYLKKSGEKYIFPTTTKPQESIFPKLETIDSKSDLLTKSVHNNRLGVYTISKTKTGRLPVYIEVRRNNVRETIIRRVEGDVIQLKKDLQEVLPSIDPSAFKVLQESKKVVIKGDYLSAVRNVLKNIVV